MLLDILFIICVRLFFAGAQQAQVKVLRSEFQSIHKPPFRPTPQNVLRSGGSGVWFSPPFHFTIASRNGRQKLAVLILFWNACVTAERLLPSKCSFVAVAGRTLWRSFSLIIRGIVARSFAPPVLSLFALAVIFRKRYPSI